MIPVSTDYIENVIAQTRQFKSKVTINMDAFSQLSPQNSTVQTNLTNKVTGSTKENPNIVRYAKNNAVQKPPANGGTWTELTQSYYNAIMTVDQNPFDVHATTSGNYPQILFSFDMVTLFEQTYGTAYWQGATTLAEKVALLKTYVTDLTFKFWGYGNGVSQAGQPAVTTYNNVRYIRDTLNGNSVNANNYWNEIQAMTAGGTNRAAGKTPTISSGTLTNPANITDGSASTYGYEASGNGVAKQLTIDLGAVYSDVTQIKVYHYYADGRTFHGTKTEISADGTTWTTLYDSAVSGEYVETSSGKTYAVPSTTTPATNDVVSNQIAIVYWNATTAAWQWNATLAPSPTTITEEDYHQTAINDIIGADGFARFIAYAQYPATANTAADIFTDYAELDFNVSFTKIREYEDDVVMRMNIVEDISVLNDSVPSNELTLTLNNQSGDFDLLTMQSMLQIIASKPHIFAELGLVYETQSGGNYLKNANLDYFTQSTTIADNWTAYNSSGFSGTFTKVNGYTGSAQQIFASGTGGVTGIQSGNVSPNIQPTTRLYYRVLFKGATPHCWIMKNSGNQNITSGWTINALNDGSGWSEMIGSWTTNNTAAESMGFLVGLDTRTTLVDTTTTVDNVWFSNYDYYDMKTVTEWVPMGKYFITEWKNDLTSKVVTFTANDYFKLFADTNYAPSGITNLHDLAADVLTKAGVPTADQYIDSSLANITVNSFTDNIDSRSAIQQIAIVAQCAVYQDRDGNIVISPFASIDKASNYISYPTTQNHLPPAYTGGSTYPLMSTGSGMRNITYDSMYNPPEIVLEQSVYQLIVKIYDANGNEQPDAVYTNTDLNGTNGVSFTIDSKLVNSVAIADKIAKWYFAETNYNAVYTINWRQNPALECTDVVLINDPFHAEKQTRIIHQEIDYEGYLSGVTQSRGGV